MQKKTITVLLSIACLLSLSFTPIPNPSDPCEDLQLVYEDALTYFSKNRGEQKVKKTLFGTANYNDYNINLWDAQKIELTEAVDLGANQLEFIYIESELLAEAETVYYRLIDQFEACNLKGYIKVEGTSKNYVAKEHFIDERDKDAFLFYNWPEFEFVISNISGTYTVKLRILSKKFN